MTEVLHRTWPKARIEHECSSCSRVIERGEVYVRDDCVDEGLSERFSWKSCLQCHLAFQWAWRKDGLLDSDEGLDLQQWLSDYRFDSMQGARLYVYFARGWRRLDGALVDARTLIEGDSHV